MENRQKEDQIGHNICIGPRAGDLITSGHHNIILGPGDGLTNESYIFAIGKIHKKMSVEDYDYLKGQLIPIINWFLSTKSYEG